MSVVHLNISYGLTPFFSNRLNDKLLAFVVKLKWRKDLPVGSTDTSAQFRNDENVDSAGNGSDGCMGSEVSATDKVNRGTILLNDFTLFFLNV